MTQSKKEWVVFFFVLFSFSGTMLLKIHLLHQAPELPHITADLSREFGMTHYLLTEALSPPPVNLQKEVLIIRNEDNRITVEEQGPGAIWLVPFAILGFYGWAGIFALIFWDLKIIIDFTIGLLALVGVVMTIYIWKTWRDR